MKLIEKDIYELDGVPTGSPVTQQWYERITGRIYRKLPASKLRHLVAPARNRWRIARRNSIASPAVLNSK